jgi:Flp pilus assembly pilin Flp
MIQALQRFWRDERGIGTLEIIIIIAVLVLVAIAFRKWIISWVTDLFDQTNSTIQEIDNKERPAGLFPPSSK